MTKQEFIEYLSEHLTYEDIEKANAEAKAYVEGFIEGLDARPEPLGEWIRRDSWSEGVGMGESYGWYFECSICGDLVKGGLNGAGNFCSSCGARMVK